MKLLAYMLGDGNMTGGVPRFTNANPAVREDFRDIEAVGEFGGLGVREENSGGTRTPTLCVRADRAVVRRYRQAFSRSLRQAVVEARRPAAEIAGVLGQSGVIDQLVARKDRARRRDRLPVARGAGRQLREAGGLRFDPGAQERAERLAPVVGRAGFVGKRGQGQFVPDAVFRCPREELVLFLEPASRPTVGRRCSPAVRAQLGYCTVSERLARQVQHLLLRFGVVATLCKRSVKYGKSRRPAFQLNITEPRSIRTFVEEIGIFGKEAAVERVGRSLEGKRPTRTGT